MNELKEKLRSFGLSDEQIEQSIVAVVEFAKSKLPAQFHGAMDDVIAGKTPDIGGLLGGLGGFFGR